MSEEKEKPIVNEPTAAEVAERLEGAKFRGQGFVEIKNFKVTSHRWPWGIPLYGGYGHPHGVFRVKDEEGKEHFVFAVADPYPTPDVVWYMNSNELALASNELALTDEPRAEEAGEPQRRADATEGVRGTDEEASARILINAALAEVERTRMVTGRDDEDIQRLKEETRAILNKLQAA